MKKQTLKINIYLDMDDTLVATSPLIQKKYNHPTFWIHTATKYKNPLIIWKNLNIWRDVSKDPTFWSELEPKENYRDLFVLARHFDDEPKILTALPKFIFKKDSPLFLSASTGKLNWLGKYLPEIVTDNVYFTYSRLKHLYVSGSPEILSILIDDNKKICDRWIKAGGIAYQINAENKKSSIDDIEKKLEHLKTIIESCATKQEVLNMFHLNKI